MLCVCKKKKQQKETAVGVSSSYCCCFLLLYCMLYNVKMKRGEQAVHNIVLIVDKRRGTKATGGWKETRQRSGCMDTVLPLAHIQFNFIYPVKHTYHSYCVCACSELRTWLWGVLYVYQWQCTPPCQIQASPTCNKKSFLPNLLLLCTLILPRPSMWNITLDSGWFPVRTNKYPEIPAVYRQINYKSKSISVRPQKSYNCQRDLDERKLERGKLWS